MAAKKQSEPWSLGSFLMGGRKSFDGSVNGELELLSGAARPEAVTQLEKRFKIGYDTRPRGAVKSVRARSHRSRIAFTS